MKKRYFITNCLTINQTKKRNILMFTFGVFGVFHLSESRPKFHFLDGRRHEIEENSSDGSTSETLYENNYLAAYNKNY